jgi:hypothetical protein
MRQNKTKKRGIVLGLFIRDKKKKSSAFSCFQPWLEFQANKQYRFIMEWNIFLPDMEAQKSLYLEQLAVTTSQVKDIMNEPQRTDLWKKYRQGRMTASNYGAAVGHNKYASTRSLLKNLLWDDFKGNAATEHGTKCEPVAAQIYEKFVHLQVQQQQQQQQQQPPETFVPMSTDPTTKPGVEFYYPGLIVCQKYPWLAVSPDGLPCINGIRFLLEIKCPFNGKLYPFIPQYYYDQVQGIMGILKLPFCDFVVWTHRYTQIRRIAFDVNYWRDFLFPQLQTFYMNEYLPRLILKQRGLLKKGELEPLLQNQTTRVSHKRKFEYLQDVATEDEIEIQRTTKNGPAFLWTAKKPPQSS